MGLDLVLLAALSACGGGESSRPPLNLGDGDADGDSDSDSDGDADGLCIDYDGDGRGPLCEVGGDCNDEDPEIWEGCSGCRAGAVQEGCPCFGTEAPNPCHSDELYEDEHGRLRCRNGERYCREEPAGSGSFLWSECHYFP